MLDIGSKVRLYTPDNPRLNGASGTISEIHEWGAIILTVAAATGTYRASYNEMTPEPMAEVNGAGYTGNICPECGGVRMIRSGVCETCSDCGATSGCS